MAKAINKIQFTGDITGFENFVKSVSINNPKNAVLAFTRFDKGYAIVYKSLSAIPVDCAESRQMISVYNGNVAFVNGKLVKPSQSWQQKQILKDKSND